MGTKRVGWARIRSLINENQNQLKIRNNEVVACSVATTLTAAQSGAEIYWTHSAGNHNITLPAAEVGLNFKFIIKVGHAANHDIVCAGSDEIFGKAVVTGTNAKNLCAAQVVTRGSGDTKIRLHNGTGQAGLAGNVGDVIHLRCLEAGHWICDAALTSTNAAPDGISVII